MVKIEAVVFDIGNVLIEWQPENFYDKEIGIKRRKQMFATVDLHAMNDRVDRGENFKSVIYETAKKYSAWKSEIEMWHDRWTELASPVITGSVDLLRELRDSGTTVFTLTNFGIESFALAEQHFEFLREFDKRYISGHMKVIKPDAKIYRMVEEDCKIAPDRLLFTDDRIDNIAAASGRGWKTHLFDGPEGWRKCLVSYGLLPN